MKKKITLKPKMNWFQKMRQRYQIIKEMIGRTDVDMWSKATSIWNVYKNPIIDDSKVNYALARSFYYASKVVDNRTGKEYGAKFILGAVFSKPIVNSITNFTLNKPLQIKCDDEYTQQIVNSWLRDNHGLILQATRNAFRDGDSYIKIDSAANGSLIAPECVDKIVDYRNINNLLGYDITYVYNEDDNPTKQKKIKIEIRQDYKRTYEITDNKKELIKEEKYKNKPFEIVQISNEPEPNALYGNTEYQSCITLMANYNAVLESAIQNHIYNSTSVPSVEGIENIEEFYQKNGTLNENGEYEIEWDGKKMFVLGKGGSIKMIEGADTSKGAETLLNLIFWCICQSSETPEFIFGTAVQSSKASVSEQMPVMIAKAQRKQAVLVKYYRNLITLLLDRLANTDSKVKKHTEFDVILPDIVDEDKKTNLEIVKVLLENNVITKETAARIIGLGEWVDNIEDEVNKAVEEKKDTIQNELDLTGIATSNRATEEKK